MDLFNQNLDRLTISLVNYYVSVIRYFLSLCLTLYVQSYPTTSGDSGATSSGMLSGVGPLWPAIMIASSAFQAGASIVKVMP